MIRFRNFKTKWHKFCEKLAFEFNLAIKDIDMNFVLEQILRHYPENDKNQIGAYHVIKCLEAFEHSRTIISGLRIGGVDNEKFLLEIEAILWFHGLIRTPGDKNNVAKTVNLTKILLSRLGAPKRFVLRVTNGIIAIRSHQEQSDDRAIQIAINIHHDTVGRY
ncbi:MAG: hypothetical protein UW46_C0001G0089 [Candidatus Yanofskybacteria bacterium GW2011_GWF1_44_227]|uniref:Uncharacterized protein n=1 Tax=Candidatus Yanofskybacteria bacterium GW2011_GWE2_40_11 TaxID=1619033 RepID=A0A0G0T212_9BACT|nr:MAG: hypothetical protein UT69_C0013G0019 [Candidatus Yanofskybacteria bacterium GW2011_GWE1_40_10]KKR41115.1 MAG: hypothetical protein UT75_C0001G0019 [Candidatus Yanofskybacteria bacterium GW2011_GWE2_40_11]KKT15887.1 MAG: hypothetical protein UV97_C0001G0060 [Candidatus Yanofskybacteria bacterium GW2011_GWF2_43_596]KKT53599.1 MAG: hypothetical protein UW46_C0001G0089 [Candidatus Yanofskybacteria bacterium GW2011_GWF1_44_227]OGN36274.1 MAG: hypothetical protein A2241_00840 [Candidatus Yano